MRTHQDAALLQAAAHESKNVAAMLEDELALLAALLGSPDACHDDRTRAFCGRIQARAAALRRRLVAFTLLLDAPGAPGLRIETVSAGELLDELLAGLALDPSSSGIAVQRREGIDELLLDCDAGRLGLVLEGALHNALRYARCRIGLDVMESGGGMLLRVDDDGPGPGACGSERSRGSHATGLGLRLAETIAAAHRRHGRTGWARLSAHPDGGGRFEIWLP